MKSVPNLLREELPRRRENCTSNAQPVVGRLLCAPTLSTHPRGGRRPEASGSLASAPSTAPLPPLSVHPPFQLQFSFS